MSPRASERFRSALQREIARHVRSTLVPLVWTFVAVYGLFAVAHLVYLPPPLSVELALMAGATSLLSLGLALRWRRRPPPLGLAHAAQGFAAGLMQINSGVHLLLTLEPQQVSNLAMVQLGAGFLFLSGGWFALSTVLSLSPVMVAWVLEPAAAGWGHFLFMIASATGASITIFVIHLREVRRTETARLKNDLHTRAQLAQQKAVASLGQLSLAERDQQVLLEACAKVVRDTLEARCVRVEQAGRSAQAGEPETANGAQRLTFGGGPGIPATTFELHFERAPSHEAAAFVESLSYLLSSSLRRLKLESDQLAAERALMQASRMESIAMLSGGVAHDFNNLLSVILGESEYLLQGQEPQSPAVQPIQNIIDASQVAARLTQQLLAFSRRQPMQIETFDLRRSLQELEPLLRRSVTGPIEMCLRVTGEPCFVRAERSQLDQVVMNLVVNARDAIAGRGSIHIALGTSNGEASPGQQATAGERSRVVLEVTDDGAGIDPEVLQRIFEPFFTTKGASGGTGLGLATAYGIVHQCGGSIAVDSVVGKGTRFCVSLPLAPAPGAARPRRARRDDRRVTTLVLDDSDPVRASLARILKECGHLVLEAASGPAALSLAQRHEEIQLLVSDIVMPEMSGYEVAAQLRMLHPEVVILFVSGHLGSSPPPASMEASPRIAYLRKPFTIDEIKAAISGYGFGPSAIASSG